MHVNVEELLCRLAPWTNFLIDQTIRLLFSNITKLRHKSFQVQRLRADMELSFSIGQGHEAVMEASSLNGQERQVRIEASSFLRQGLHSGSDAFIGTGTP